MVRLAVPGVVTLELSKVQVPPAREVDTAQVRATAPVKPSFGVTLSDTVALAPAASDTLLETGRTTKCGFGVPFNALRRAVASTEPQPVTRS
jgi:hypothetical protein